jgi:hypothetical protein
MNVFHGLGDDDEAVGQHFLLDFLRCVNLHGIGHVFIYSGMARARMSWEQRECF